MSETSPAVGFTAIAIHHAAPAHAEEFMAFMRRVVEHTGSQAGLLEFRGWRDVASTRLVGISRWESRERFEAALPSIMALSGECRPEWLLREDDVLMLEPV